jgi:hypothetical protein
LNFSAKGVLGRDELRLSEFKGGIYGGSADVDASMNINDRFAVELKSPWRSVRASGRKAPM